MKVFLAFWAIMTFVTFFAYASDKAKAVKGRWRIKEKTLLCLAFFMGAPGALLGMYVLRHKTRKTKFTVLVPLFLILQTTALVFLIV